MQPAGLARSPPPVLRGEGSDAPSPSSLDAEEMFKRQVEGNAPIFSVATLGALRRNQAMAFPERCYPEVARGIAAPKAHGQQRREQVRGFWGAWGGGRPPESPSRLS